MLPKNKEIRRGYKEIDRLGGDDPYSASKAAAEIVYNSYLKSKLVNLERHGVATARAGNVIGVEIGLEIELFQTV